MPEESSPQSRAPSLLPSLTFRTIDPVAEAWITASHHRQASVASFGSGVPYPGEESYLKWLRSRVEEFPDGHVLAFRRDTGECVGQLELQVPYGQTTGYVNLFYVSRRLRRKGYGRALHEYAERYFRSWEAARIDLHVSPTNPAAVAFYGAVGYRLARVEPRRPGSMWLMSKLLGCAVTHEP